MATGKKYHFLCSDNGFTVVELVVVISIIGVLSSAVILIINPAELLKRARDSRRKQDLQLIANYLSLYIQEYDELPEGSIHFCMTDEGIRGSDDRSVNEGRVDTATELFHNCWLKILENSPVASAIPDDPDSPDGGGPPNYEYRNTKNGYYEYWKNQVYVNSHCWDYLSDRFVLMTGLEDITDSDCMVDESGTTYGWRSLTPPRCAYVLQDGSRLDSLVYDPDGCPPGTPVCNPITP